MIRIISSSVLRGTAKTAVEEWADRQLRRSAQDNSALNSAQEAKKNDEGEVAQPEL